MGCKFSKMKLEIAPAKAQANRLALTTRVPKAAKVKNPFIVSQKLPKPYEFPTHIVLQERQNVHTARNLEVELDENLMPHPFPTPSLKKEVFNIDDYQELDQFAIKTPMEHARKSYEELAHYLTQKAQTEMEKVRVLFRWVTAQDLSKYKFRRTIPQRDTPMYCLWKIQNGVTSYYDTLLSELFKAANVISVRIEGIVKGVNYSPGDNIAENTNDYIGGWLAVLIDNIWRLIDPHWASSHVEGEDTVDDWALVYGLGGPVAKPTQPRRDNNDLSVQYAYNEFYFLTDPVEFIYTHLPEDPRWQLLARQVTLEEFNDLAYLRPGFFNLDMKVINHETCLVEVSHGDFELQLGLPTDKVLRFRHLLYAVADEADAFGDLKLDRYMFRERRDDVLRIKIIFPKVGLYKLELYGNTVDAQSGYNLELLRYVINCEKATSDLRAMPISDRREWGPGPGSIAMGMTPLSHKRGVVQAAKDGTCEIRFEMETPLEFMYTCKHDEMCEDDMKRFIVYRIEDDVVIFSMKCPREGMYGFGIYARRLRGAASEHFKSVCDYLVEAEQACEYKTPYPLIKKGGLGATELFKGLVTETDLAPFLSAPDVGEMKIVISTKSPMMYQATMLKMNEEGLPPTSATDYVFFQHKIEETTIFLRFRDIGQYHLKLHGKPVEAEGILPMLYNSVIQVDWPKPGATPFPKPMSSWGIDHVLITPNTRQLPPLTSVKFEVKVPQASNVTVAEEDVWSDLQKGEDSVWRGHVQTSEGKTDLKVSCCGADMEEYHTLLVYQVVTAEVWDQMERLQGRTMRLVDKKKENKIKLLQKEHKELETKLNKLEEVLEQQRQKEGLLFATSKKLTALEEFGEIKMEINEQIADFDRVRVMYDEILYKKKEIIHGYQDIIKRRKLDTDARRLLQDYHKLEGKNKHMREDAVLKAFNDNQAVREKLQEEVGRRIKKLREIERDRIKIHEESTVLAENLDELRRILENHVSQFEHFKLHIPESAQLFDVRIEDCQNRIDESEERRVEHAEQLTQYLKYLLQMRETLDMQDHIVYNWEEQNVSMARTENIMKQLVDMLKDETEALRLGEEAQRMRAEAERMLNERNCIHDQLRAELHTLDDLRDKMDLGGIQISTDEEFVVLRRALEVATKLGGETAIKQAMIEHRKHKVPDLGECASAEKVLILLKTLNELLHAMDQKSPEVIQKCVVILEKSEFKEQFNLELLEANALIESLQRINNLNKELMKASEAELMEIRGLRDPPACVRDVVVATLLLLSEGERNTRDWSYSQKLLNPVGPYAIVARLISIDIDFLHPEIVARVREILDLLDIEDIRGVSSGAARLYQWTSGLAVEHDIVIARKRHPPANMRRQTEIFALREHSRYIKRVSSKKT